MAQGTKKCCCDFRNLPLSSLYVRAGSTSRSSGGLYIKVAQITRHPQYDAATIDYDIAVIELSQQMNFIATMKPIPLPASNFLAQPGMLAVVSGWGTAKEGAGSVPQNLKAVMLPIVSMAQCRSIYGQWAITDRMLCAGYSTGGKDACQVRPDRFVQILSELPAGK